jgi:hypothetical protein
MAAAFPLWGLNNQGRLLKPPLFYLRQVPMVVAFALLSDIHQLHPELAVWPLVHFH